MELGRNTIHKLGKRIRESYGDGTGYVKDEDLKKLQEYRLSYRDAIAEVFKILYAVSKKIDKHCIVTYRVKRINSIIGKLKRYPTAGLENIVDIAGCRCISYNDDYVYKIVKKLIKHPQLTVSQVKDRIKDPKEDGYKSVHLYVNLKALPEKSIEIQVRSRKQHDWATLVEISDVIIEGSKLKEYGEPKDLQEFHHILSLSENMLTEEQRAMYFDILKKYDYIKLMHHVFIQNLLLRYDWVYTHSSALKNFFLIESGAYDKTKIDSFQTFTEAESAYFERFKLDSNANLVLTQIPNVTFEQLSMAYSNYVLSTHNFTNDCIDRCFNEIRRAMRDRNFALYKKVIETYFNVTAHQMIRFNQEIYVINRTPLLQNNPKHREWLKDLQKQNALLLSRRDKLGHIYKETKMSEANLFTRFRFESYFKKMRKKYDEFFTQEMHK